MRKIKNEIKTSQLFESGRKFPANWGINNAIIRSDIFWPLRVGRRCTAIKWNKRKGYNSSQKLGKMIHGPGRTRRVLLAVDFLFFALLHFRQIRYYNRGSSQYVNECIFLMRRWLPRNWYRYGRFLECWEVIVVIFWRYISWFATFTMLF